MKQDAKHNTLEQIHIAAKKEFLEKGFKTASLRNIVKMAGVTTGAFYGYYKSKEELFGALVDEQYHYVMEHFCQAQDEFAELPAEEQPDHVGEISVDCMLDVLLYAQNYPEEFQLLLCCAEGTRYARMIDEMVEIEVEATHRYQESLDSVADRRRRLILCWNICWQLECLTPILKCLFIRCHLIRRRYI